MNPKEQEIAIGELEERVDRLRNIYEQYFLGFEKLEPTVPRKDVDRRLAILRKEQIRNTAMRFRFQVVTQKYNTYSMHWIRICRQIEEGTYKRHIRKAKARFGDVTRPDAERESSFDVDIDIDDFDVSDMDAMLAEANAAIETHELVGQDTVPPPPPPVRAADRSSVAPERSARGAALPAGAKPLILRKREEGDPASQRMVTSAAGPSSQRVMPAAAGPSSQRLMPSAPGPSSQRAVPGAPGPSSQRVVPAAGPSSQSSQRMIPESLPSSERAMPSAASQRIMAGAAPPSLRAIPAMPGSAGSAGAPPSQRAVPGAPHAAPQLRPFNPASRAPGSVPAIQHGHGGASVQPPSERMSAATPSAGAPAAGRIPVAARSERSEGAAGGSGAARSPAGPPSGAARVPGSDASTSPKPRAPLPSVADTDPAAGTKHPSTRPRAPLPLPSQLVRPPTKKE